MATNNQNSKFLNDIIASDLLEQAIDWIQSNLAPDDVFSDSDLERWAESNGFIREE